MGKAENTDLARRTLEYIKRPRNYDGIERSLVALNNGDLKGENLGTSLKYDNAYEKILSGLRPEMERINTDNDRPGKRLMKLMGSAALESGFGNCQLQAALGFRFLKKECSAVCIDVMQAAYTNEQQKADYHSFLVIGRPDDLKSVAFMQCEDAVVCDAWAPDGLRIYDAGVFDATMLRVIGPFVLEGSSARLNSAGKAVW